MLKNRGRARVEKIEFESACCKLVVESVLKKLGVRKRVLKISGRKRVLEYWRLKVGVGILR